MPAGPGRTTLLLWMGRLGKWSMLDPFTVLVLVMLASDQWAVSATTFLGVYAFLTAVAITMVLSMVASVLDEHTIREREVAPRPGRQPAPEGREFEGLGVVAQSEPVGPERLLDGGSEGTGLDARDARDFVHLEHAVERREVHGHNAAEALGGRDLDAADDARTAAPGHQGHVRLTAPGEELLDLRLVLRERYAVGRAAEVRVEAAELVTPGATVGVAYTGARGRGAKRPQRLGRRDTGG